MGVTTLRQKVASGASAELDVLDEIGIVADVADDGVGVMEGSLAVDDSATEDDAESDVEESLLDIDKDGAMEVEDGVVARLLLLVVLTTSVEDDTSDELDELLVEAEELIELLDAGVDDEETIVEVWVDEAAVLTELGRTEVERVVDDFADEELLEDTELHSP